VFRSSRQLRRSSRLRALALGVSVAGTASVLTFAGAAQAAAPTPPAVRSHSPLVAVDNLRGYQFSLLDGSTGSVLGRAPEGVQFGIRDPAGMAVGVAGNQVFVTNHDSGSVSVVNAATGTVITVVHVGASPTSVTMAPGGGQAYISVARGLAVLDTATDQLAATIALPAQPTGVVFLPGGGTAYALEGPSGVSSVSVIDTATDTVTASISGFNFPTTIVASHDGARVYVVGQRRLYVIGTASNTIVRKYYLGGVPTQLTLAPDGSRLYITMGEYYGLNALDLETGKLIRLAIGSHQDPRDILLSADGSTAYLLEGDQVAVYDVATKSVTATIPLSFAPGTGALAPDGSVLYVAGQGSLARIDLATGTATAVTSPVSVGQIVYAAGGSVIYLLGSGQVVSLDTATESTTPLTDQFAVSVGIALAPNARTAYVADRSGNAVAVVDLVTGTVTAIIPVDRAPQSILVNPDGKYVYVTNRYRKSVTVIDTATNSVSATITGLGNYPGPMALSPDGATLYVANTSTSYQYTMINTATNQVTGTSGNEGPTAALAVNPSGKVLYEVYQAQREMVIEARNAANLAPEWSKTLYGGLAQGSLAISRDSKYVYFAQTETDKVFVFDVATRKIIAKIAVGSRPESVALSPDGTRLFVANSGSGTVTVIDTATNTVATTINVGGFPDGISVPGQLSSTYPQRI
jgi:YVTN family beta-propeller protein